MYTLLAGLGMCAIWAPAKATHSRSMRMPLWYSQYHLTCVLRSTILWCTHVPHLDVAALTANRHQPLTLKSVDVGLADVHRGHGDPAKGSEGVHAVQADGVRGAGTVRDFPHLTEAVARHSDEMRAVGGPTASHTHTY